MSFSSGNHPEKPRACGAVPSEVTSSHPPAPSARRPRLLRVALAGVALALAAGCWACSPIYVMKAGLAEMRILRARRPIPEVLADSGVDAATRAKLELVLEARAYAAEELGIDVGDSYTSYTRLESDTLALVLSAAHKDRLVSRTWWFPVVGHVPYKGFFSEADARGEQERLEREGFDTYLRPTAAFSTLGWFDDPVLSTLLDGDDIEVVATVLHELSHQHLFVPGEVGFNESFATFAGRVGAAGLFCSRSREGGPGPDMEACAESVARWRDHQRFSVFVDELVADLEDVYADQATSPETKLERREEVFAAALRRFDARIAPSFEALTFGGFRQRPLNNATLLASVRYYHRLPDFEAFLEAHGSDLRAALAELRARVSGTEDPFDVLPDRGAAATGAR